MYALATANSLPQTSSQTAPAISMRFTSTNAHTDRHNYNGNARKEMIPSSLPLLTELEK